MTATMVCFDSADASYCLPVGAIRAVRPATGIVALPAPSPDIAGIIPGNPPLTVVAPLAHHGGSYIVVIDTSDKIFGLLVDAVTGLRRIDENMIRVAPDGQERPLISGTVVTDGKLVLIADPIALSSRL
jgi:chemotaxis signal transduction protein